MQLYILICITANIIINSPFVYLDKTLKLGCVLSYLASFPGNSFWESFSIILSAILSEDSLIELKKVRWSL